MGMRASVSGWCAASAREGVVRSVAVFTGLAIVGAVGEEVRTLPSTENKPRALCHVPGLVAAHCTLLCCCVPERL